MNYLVAIWRPISRSYKKSRRMLIQAHLAIACKDTIRYKMNLGSNVSPWISLLPKISNAPLVCCLSARLRGLLSLVE